MNPDRTPGEIAAERILADPDFMRRHLNDDLAAVALLGRTGAQADPIADEVGLVESIRSAADRIGFASPIEAAAEVKRRLIELPVSERVDGTAMKAYHDAASRTIHDGGLDSHSSLSDGTRVLEFHRQGQDTDLVSIALSARVRVEHEGSVYLDGFGWPCAPGRPVHTFAGSAEDDLAQALSDLHDPNVPLDRAMLLLLGAAQRESGGAGSRQERTMIAERIALRRGELSAYVKQAETYALASAGASWYPACLYRSALENLFEAFLGSASFALVDMEEIEAIDEELRERLPDNEYAVSSAIPSFAPSHHWWWQAAAQGGRGRSDGAT
jgi:hypothetical protein